MNHWASQCRDVYSEIRFEAVSRLSSCTLDTRVKSKFAMLFYFPGIFQVVSCQIEFHSIIIKTGQAKGCSVAPPVDSWWWLPVLPRNLSSWKAAPPVIGTMHDLCSSWCTRPSNF